jgi:hypothetical protein
MVSDVWCPHCEPALHQIPGGIDLAIEARHVSNIADLREVRTVEPKGRANNLFFSVCFAGLDFFCHE